MNSRPSFEPKEYPIFCSKKMLKQVVFCLSWCRQAFSFQCGPSQIINTFTWCHSAPWKGWGRGQMDTCKRAATFICSQLALTAAAETFRQLCWSSYLVRFKAWASSRDASWSSQLFLINGLAWFDKPRVLTISLTHGKIPSGPVSWERCILKTTSVKAKISMCSGHSNWERGRQRQQDRGEGPRTIPKCFPLASQAASPRYSFLGNPIRQELQQIFHLPMKKLT